MAQFSRRRIAHTITDRLLAGESPATAMQQLAAYLLEHKLSAQADRYIDDIEQLLAENGYIVADVTTARPLDKTLRDQIKTAVAKDAKQVTLREYVDPELIGGIVVSTSGKQLDASVRNTLRRLRTS